MNDEVYHDGYGDQPGPEPTVEQFIVASRPFLLGVLTGWGLRSTDERFDDVLQEGRIALWRSYEALAGEPQRIRFARNTAKQRMSGIAFRKGVPTQPVQEPGKDDRGRERSLVRRYEPTPAFSHDELLDAGLDSLLWANNPLEGVELAYHHGEIADAIAALTPGQQRYVYARFWCGMDPSDGLNNNLMMREARANNPFLKRDIYWTGSKESKGAKRKLAEALEHLAGVV